jgi:hypothetical protein
MTQFTLFFARLVDLIGSEKAAALVNELAGQTIQFPVAGHNAELIKRTVTKQLTILFNGAPYDVSHLPGVSVGDVITVTIANLKPIKLDDFGFFIDAPIIGERYKPLSVAEANVLANKLVQESTRANGKKLLTHADAANLLQANLLQANLLQANMAFQPTVEDIAHRDAVLALAEACNVSLSAAIRLLKAERQHSTAPLSSAGTAPVPDQFVPEGHAAPAIPPAADPNQ